ncbi:MAG: gamma-glutamyl-phosphate reductase, partial [Syntrophaceae bacterium]|nr:gamma-glutamyl-phosphate reductase [Syntrophaceae bacterium]
MDIKNSVKTIAQNAQEASRRLARVSCPVKNKALMQMADELIKNSDQLIAENTRDVVGAEKQGLSKAMIDRLTLKKETIESMAQGLREVAALPDPLGKVTSMWRRPNGLLVGRMRIPLGVIGIIYESRPNVTADAAALCLKSG